MAFKKRKLEKEKEKKKKIPTQHLAASTPKLRKALHTAICHENPAIQAHAPLSWHFLSAIIVSLVTNHWQHAASVSANVQHCMEGA
jgi:hypothetical protein